MLFQDMNSTFFFQITTLYISRFSFIRDIATKKYVIIAFGSNCLLYVENAIQLKVKKNNVHYIRCNEMTSNNIESGN